MKIQHIRNATMIIEVNNQVLLVDPMMSDVGTIPSLSFFRFKSKKNPTVPLPDNCQDSFDRVTHCLITHMHPDHIDTASVKYLIKKEIPVTCSVKDEKALKRKGLNIVQTIDYWKRTGFLGGKLEGIPARHGYGFVAKPAGNVMGFYLEFPNQPSIYLSSDTIYTKDVEKVLKEYKPSISVLAAGTAQFDVFKPLLMTMKDMIRFTKDAPNKVIMNHMESMNHCPTTRKDLKKKMMEEGLIEKTLIPEDGEWMEIH